MSKITLEMVEAAGKVIYGKEFTGDSEVVRKALEAARDAEKKVEIVMYPVNVNPQPPVVVVNCRCGGRDAYSY